MISEQEHEIAVETNQLDPDSNLILEDDSNAPSATVFSSITNLSNTILGSGMLAMPYAFARVGLGLGVGLVALSSLASGFGLYLLLLCAQFVNNRNTSFFAVSQLTYPEASLYFDIAIAIKCFGVSISYLIIIGDLMPQIIEYIYIDAIPILLQRNFWITVFMIPVIKLAFLRKLDSLKYTSIIALGSVVYLVSIVAFSFLFSSEPIQWDKIRFFAFDYDFFTTLPIFVFGFTCHQNLFSIFNELVNNNGKNMKRVIVGSVGAGFSVYQVVGSLGYLSFGPSVKSNILAMYQLGPILTLGRFAVVILVLFSYPLQCHPCRNCLMKVIGVKDEHKKYCSVANDESEIEEELPANRDFYFNAITVLILVGTYLIAISVKTLDIVLALVGSTGSTTISFILPGFFYLKLTSTQPINVFDTSPTFLFGISKHSIVRGLAKVLTAYGITVMIISLSFNLKKYLQF